MIVKTPYSRLAALLARRCAFENRTRLITELRLVNSDCRCNAMSSRKLQETLPTTCLRKDDNREKMVSRDDNNFWYCKIADCACVTLSRRGVHR